MYSHNTYRHPWRTCWSDRVCIRKVLTDILGTHVRSDTMCIRIVLTYILGTHVWSDRQCFGDDTVILLVGDDDLHVALCPSLRADLLKENHGVSICTGSRLQ